MKLKMSSIAAILLAALFLCAQAIGQEKRTPSRADVDNSLNHMVRQFNAKMSQTKVDEWTVIKMMTYDEAIPTLGYIYDTSYLAATGKSFLTDDYIQSIRKFNIRKTCGSQFKILMQVYNLEVVHSFSDAFTGKILLNIRVTINDCV